MKNQRMRKTLDKHGFENEPAYTIEKKKKKYCCSIKKWQAIKIAIWIHIYPMSIYTLHSFINKEDNREVFHHSMQIISRIFSLSIIYRPCLLIYLFFTIWIFKTLYNDEIYCVFIKVVLKYSITWNSFYI